jgi:hypothetical protein
MCIKKMNVSYFLLLAARHFLCSYYIKIMGLHTRKFFSPSALIHNYSYFGSSLICVNL